MSLSVSSPLRWALTGYGTGEPFVPLRVKPASLGFDRVWDGGAVCPLRIKPASLGFDRVWDGTAFLISRSCRQRPHWGAADALSFWGASFSPRCHSEERLFPPAVILRSVFFPAVILRSVFSPAVILRSGATKNLYAAAFKTEKRFFASLRMTGAARNVKDSPECQGQPGMSRTAWNVKDSPECQGQPGMTGAARNVKDSPECQGQPGMSRTARNDRGGPECQGQPGMSGAARNDRGSPE